MKLFKFFKFLKTRPMSYKELVDSISPQGTIPASILPGANFTGGTPEGYVGSIPALETSK